MRRNASRKSPTRVLHVVFSLEPGGMENGVINVVNALGADFSIKIACLETRGPMAARLQAADVVTVLNKKPGFSVKTVRQLGGLIRQFRPHVLHTHNLGPLIYGSLATTFGSRIPILHGEHSQLSPEDLRPRRLHQRRIFYRSVREVHTVSRDLAQNLLAANLGLGSRRIRAIVNGVDTSRFRPGRGDAIREKLKIPSNAPVIGIVGRFGPFKRHELLIDAFEKIRARGSPTHLLVIGGGGSEEERVRARCAASPEAAAIHLLGFSNHPEVLYPALDLLAVPSVNEGLSNVILEAMACAIPVLAHRACGSTEVIQTGVNGVVADLSSADRLAAELEHLLAGSELRLLLGKNARRSVETEFSLDRMVGSYADLYRKLRDE